MICLHFVVFLGLFVQLLIYGCYAKHFYWSKVTVWYHETITRDVQNVLQLYILYFVNIFISVYIFVIIKHSVLCHGLCGISNMWLFCVEQNTQLLLIIDYLSAFNVFIRFVNALISMYMFICELLLLITNQRYILLYFIDIFISANILCNR